MNNLIPPHNGVEENKMNAFLRIKKFVSLYKPKCDKIISFLNTCKSAIFNKILSIIKLRQKGPVEVIGLDIGGGSIKAAKVRYIEGEPFLVKTKIVEFQLKIDIEKEVREEVKEGETKEGEVKEGAELEKQGKIGPWEEAVVKTLKNIFLDLEVSPWTKIVTVVSGPRVSVRQIVVPHKTTPNLTRRVEHLPIKKLKELIKWEAKDYLPFSMEETNIEFDARKKNIVEEDGVRRLRVCIAAAINEVGTSHIYLLREAGLSPTLITTIPFSLANLIKRYRLVKEDEVVAIIDMGKDKTDITIFKGEDIEFNRSILLAGGDINSLLTVSLIVGGRPLKLDLNQAESVKKRWGIPLSEDRTLKIEEGFSIAELLSMIRPAAERLSTEIGRTFDFYQRDLKGEQVDKIFLVGGTSRLKGLKEFLSQELGTEVEIGDFLRGIRFLPEVQRKEEETNISPTFAIAVGAALADLKGINLIPLDVRREPRRQLRRRLAKVATALIILFLLLGYKFLQLQLVKSQKEISALEAQLAYFRPQIERMSRIGDFQNQIVEKKAIIENIFSSQPYWQDVLKEISNVIPRNIYLTQLIVDKKTFILKGVLTSEGEAKRAPLTDFIRGLENSIFKNIEIVDIKKNAMGGNSVLFEIKCELN